MSYVLSSVDIHVASFAHGKFVTVFIGDSVLMSVLF